MKLYFAGGEAWPDTLNNVMKLYFTALHNGVWEEEVLDRVGIERRMLSYHYLEPEQRAGKEDLIPGYSGKLDLFIDSGAFSADSQGVDIDIEEYARFLKEVAIPNPNVSLYANLDVIGNAEATFQNQRQMEEAGFDPVPVFHLGQDLGFLEDILAEGADPIALGGMVGASSTDIRSFLDAAFSRIVQHWPVRVHSFGTTGRWLKHYPFWSADASSWVVGSKYKDVVKFDPSEGTIRSDTSKATTIRKEKTDYRQRCAINLVEYMKYERHLTRLWAKRGVEWDDHEPAIERYNMPDSILQ